MATRVTHSVTVIGPGSDGRVAIFARVDPDLAPALRADPRLVFRALGGAVEWPMPGVGSGDRSVSTFEGGEDDVR